MSKKRSKVTSYNVRIYDNGNGTFSLGFVDRFKTVGQPKNTCGTWVKGSKNKMVRLLTKGTIKE